MKHATLSDNGTIDGLYAAPQAMETQEVPDDAQIGWIMQDGTWQAPPPSAAETLRLQLLASFATLEPGVQFAFKTTADAMRDAFAREDIAAARAILETTPVLPELEDSKAALLALFPNA